MFGDSSANALSDRVVRALARACCNAGALPTLPPLLEMQEGVRMLLHRGNALPDRVATCQARQRRRAQLRKPQVTAHAFL